MTKPIIHINTVKYLKALLRALENDKQIDDNTRIELARDAEGNGFSLCCGYSVQDNTLTLWPED